MPKIQKILIANRGEIALRIMRTCRQMFIQTVAVYAEADKNAPFVKFADEAIFIGNSPASESYLNPQKILEACQISGADAIHPGYGFLSENAEFAQKVQAEGLIFIGPSPEAIEAMGSKIRAKQIVSQNGVPVVPGYNGENQAIENLILEAEKIGFPVLIKASAGGGGKGMRVVRQKQDLKTAIEGAKREALQSFGDDKVLLEKYFDSVRHIEFQIFGDIYGNLIHLFERECSIQRRHQKIIEEAPSTFLSPELRKKMGESAILAGKSINYTNAGTIEFIVDAEGNYYFLEVNTRLQVEHPVTELVTGLDLVKLQIEITEGKTLQLKPNLNGHAIEARLYAEDPQNNFLPSIGTLLNWQTPSTIRIDSGVEINSEISTFYDPMLAKIITYGANRAEAIQQMLYTLQQLVALGLKTNQAFLAELFAEEDFQKGNFDTHYLDRKPNLLINSQLSITELKEILIAVVLKNWFERQKKRKYLPNLISGWRNNTYQAQFEKYLVFDKQVLGLNQTEIKVEYQDLGKQKFEIKIHLADFEKEIIELLSLDNQSITYLHKQKRHTFWLSQNEQDFYVKSNAKSLHLQLIPRLPEPQKLLAKGAYEAPMPGEIVKILVQLGTEIEIGSPLLVINSMKMENTLYAHSTGTIEEIFVQEKTMVKAGTILLKVKEF